MSAKLAENLEWMRQRGSSVILNWGEDSNQRRDSAVMSGSRQWSKEEDAALRRMHSQGWSDKRMAAVFGRSLGAVEMRRWLFSLKAVKPAAAPSAAPGVEEER